MAVYRVRTGCKTCKIRKVKCDEVKPACNRCTSTGRTCDGYEVPPPRKSPKPRTPPSNALVVLGSERSPSPLAEHITSDELRWINYFHANTASFASTTLDTQIWTHLLPQLCHAEPAVKHSLLALAASHHRLQNNGDNTRALLRGDVFELDNYNKAIQALRKRMQQPDNNEKIALACCLIFVCLECIYANRDAVNVHLRQAQGILSATEDDPEFAVVRQTLRRLIAQSALFKLRLLDDLHLVKVVEQQTNQPRRDAFTDVHDARAVLDPLTSLVINLIQTSRWLSQGLATPTWESRLAAQLYTEMLAWRRAFDFTISRMGYSASRSNDPAPLPMPGIEWLALLIKYTSALVWLQTCFQASETVYDTCTSQFEDILIWSQQILKVKQGSRNVQQTWVFELEHCLAPGLYLTAIKCRHPAMRRQAIVLIESMVHREWLWDTKVHATVAKRIVELEEGRPYSHALVEGSTDRAIDAFAIPEHLRVRNARIDTVRGGPLVAAVQVEFYRVPQGSDGQRQSWSEMFDLE